MPRDPAVWVIDSSILIGYLRTGRYGEFLRREVARGAVYLPGVVVCELQAGATTRGDQADVETLRRALGDRVVGTDVDDWLLAGRCLVRYAERWGRIRPRDHLADLLVVVSATRLGAAIASEDLRGMMRWRWALARLGRHVEAYAAPP